MIIFTHHTGEPYGILGAQVAARFFERNLSMPSIVIGIQRNFSREGLLRFIEEYYVGKTKVVAFSHLCGRKDLIGLAQEMKQKGFVTVLGGPQAQQDFEGEPGTDTHPHRFKGLRSLIDIAYQGPVDGFKAEYLDMRAVSLASPWTGEIFLDVDWSNIYTFSEGLKRLDIRLGQVLNSIGCPHALRPGTVILPPPTHLRGKGLAEMEVRCEGCVFCDVSRDKGYHGSVGIDRLMSQVEGLPEVEKKKIPFELIDEYPLSSLGRLIDEAEKRKIKLSQINLVCRADDISRHVSELDGILQLARSQDVKIMFASIGFESFSDRILRYFCKGITVADIVQCVETLRRLKGRFDHTLLYRRDEGANHGFIRPTPWDDPETLREIDTNVFLHRFFEDILPEYSTPLIVHHASYLGEWIRQIESTQKVRFSRDGTWVEWWNPLEASGFPGMFERSLQ